MIKMNKLQGLANTYFDSASSENEFLVAGKKGKKTIQKELNCELWNASCILEIIGKGEIWFPHPDREHLHGARPQNAMEIFKGSLNKMNIRFKTVEYGFGGTTIIKL
jgi:hypothetical protein